MIKKIVNLIFEAFHLQHVKHEGWKMAGVKEPDSVAEHSLAAAQIGYILAKMEGADANKVASMLVWHDIGETRIGDIHKVGARYIENKQAIEARVLREQFEGLDFGKDIRDLVNQMENREGLEGLIAKDADYLQMAFQGKIYKDIGHKQAQDWIDNVGKALNTKSAKKIWKQMTKTSFGDWWNDLKKI